MLPGLIDCHTHLLMVEKLQNLVQMSTAERALLGASVARDALDTGITTVRDLGSSGVGLDVALRNAIRAVDHRPAHPRRYARAQPCWRPVRFHAVWRR